MSELTALARGLLLRTLTGDGMSQRAVARELGLSPQHIRNIERCAINKLRALAGLPTLPPLGDYRGRWRCSRCGERGHNIRSCGVPRGN